MTKAERLMYDALVRIANNAPTEHPEYDDWGGDTEEAERWGIAAGEYELARIARAALEQLGNLWANP